MITLMLILVLMFSINYENINIRQRINNTFNLLSTQLPDTWIRLIRVEEKEIALYKKSIVKETTINYFSNNLKGYVNKYNLKFFYYDLYDKKEFEGEYTPGVNITITVKDYYKSISYEIGGIL